MSFKEADFRECPCGNPDQEELIIIYCPDKNNCNFVIPSKCQGHKVHDNPDCRRIIENPPTRIFRKIGNQCIRV